MKSASEGSRAWTLVSRVLAVACLTAILAGVLVARSAVGGSAREPIPIAGADTVPTFDRVLLLESTAETSANVSLGDVDGDGDLDVVLAKGRHWPLVDRVLLGDGAGHFANGYDLGSASDRS